MIRFTADGKDYRLEVTPYALKTLEKNGMDFAHIGDKIITATEDLFCGLFVAHHNEVPRKKRLEIYNALAETCEGGDVEYDEAGNPIDALMSAIGDEYDNALKGLKREKGNLTWRKE